MITKELLVESGICNEVTASIWTDSLQETCEKYEINTPLRIAGFIAQCAHESGGFKFTVENLNYSTAALRAIFGKYFPNDELANEFARQPERIANKVYANRMGNGDESSGDGWKYRGRGLIQITGRDNYTSFATATGINAIDNPTMVETPTGATLSAGWFWNSRNLNAYADAGDFQSMTKRINGGVNGIEDRSAKYDALKKYLQVT